MICRWDPSLPKPVPVSTGAGRAGGRSARFSGTMRNCGFVKGDERLAPPPLVMDFRVGRCGTLRRAATRAMVALLSASATGDLALIGAEEQALATGAVLSRQMQAQRLPGRGGSCMAPASTLLLSCIDVRVAEGGGADPG